MFSCCSPNSTFTIPQPGAILNDGVTAASPSNPRRLRAAWSTGQTLGALKEKTARKGVSGKAPHCCQRFCRLWRCGDVGMWEYGNVGSKPAMQLWLAGKEPTPVLGLEFTRFTDSV